MNSLIAFPISTLQFDPSNFTITIEDSKFARFSSCGSLLSNFHLQDIAKEPEPYRDWITYDITEYFGYSNQWQKAANAYINKRYLLRKPSSYMDVAYFQRKYDYSYRLPYTLSPFERYNTGQFYSQVYLRNNSFSGFNYLKTIHHEGEEFRKPSGLNTVTHIGLRNQGLIINFYGNFNQSYISIENNTFYDTYQAYQIFDTTVNYVFEFNQNMFGRKDPYHQINHLISVVNVTATLVILNDNIFRNLSISGPLINLAEEPGYFTTAFIIANNDFSITQALVNSNILQITRSVTKINTYPYVHPANVDMYSWTQYMRLDKYLLGGSIIVMGNKFNDICGAENVDASIILIGVRHDIHDDYASKRGHFPVMQETYFKFEFQNTYNEPQNYFKDISITHPLLGEIQLVRMGVNISGNTYQNICMGPEIFGAINSFQKEPLKARGSIASFNFIPQVLMYNETYIDIGAFSYNYSVNLQKKIKNVNSIQQRFNWFMSEEVQLQSAPDYIKQSLSTSLIVVQYGQQIIMGGCHFDNIWLIDRLNALSRSQAQGLILYVEIFKGEVTLGSPDKPMILQNLNGFLNDRNIDKMMSEFELDNTISAFEKYVQYGVGSILFNLHNSSNSYNSIIMQNMEIKESYFCANKLENYDKQVRIPAILSTYLDDEWFQNVPEQVIISDIKISNVNFEGISNYFEILGEKKEINQIVIKNIGLKSFPASNTFIVEFVGSDRVSRDPKLFTSFFKIYLFTGHNQHGNDIDLANMMFSNINPSSGALPIFSFDRGYSKVDNAQCNVYMRYIDIKDSLLMDDFGDNELLPKGSLFKLETPGLVNLRVEIYKLSMSKVFSQYGIFESVGTITEVEIFKSTFFGMRGTNASILYVPFNTLISLNIYSSKFIGNKLQTIGQQQLLSLYNTNSTSNFSEPSLFKLVSVPSITILNSQFEGHNYAKQGAFLDLSQNSNVSMRGCTFSDFSAYTAGAFVLNLESYALIRDCTFSNIMAINEGVFQVNVKSGITIEASRFSQNRAIRNGVFKISGDSFFNFIQLEFNENSAYLKNSVGQVIQLGGASSINGCYFESNQAYFEYFDKIQTAASNSGKLIEFITNDARIDIYDSQFIQNKAVVGTSNLYILDSLDVNIANSKFEGSAKTFNSTKIFGDFLQISSTSQVTIASSSFKKGYAQIGGAIFVLGNAKLKIESSSFIENVAIEQGGVLFADSFMSISISNSCNFNNNRGIKNGGDVFYIYNSLNGQVFITDTLLLSLNIESNFIYASDIQSLTISSIKAEVQNFTKSNVTKHSGLYLRNIAQLKVVKSAFSGIIGSNQLGGGAVILEYSSEVQDGQIEIRDCIFENSHASYKGGGLSLNDVKSLIIQNSTFFNNSADKEGGALMFGCNQTGLIRYDCKLEIENSVFKSNNAKIEGGAIKWNFYEPQIKGQMIYANNTASEYGDNIAGVASQLVLINEQQLRERYFRKQNNGSNVKAVSSGGEFNMYFGIIDKYDNFVRTDNKSKLFISQVVHIIIVAALKKNPVSIEIPLHQQLKQKHNSLPKMASSRLKILFLQRHRIQVKVMILSLKLFRTQFHY
ncbi:hypothetical protein FGO68_gene4785 [Halteria grandinella]|uniref:Right handed beta helix domain-containing protein n=1 Tax=Halteria grandinella TaxID=5974 RepID=A0A8J8NHM7_HALGN|nr:hypothetical protein FGO68_gene4785 [Halteria grandinella]